MNTMERRRLLGDAETAVFLADGASPFNICFLVKLREPIDGTVLSRALSRVLERHPLLGARVAREGRRLVFVVDGAMGPEATIVRAALPGQKSVLELAEEELNTPFDTSRGPLARCTAADEGGGQTLLFTVHHAVADGLSAAFALRDLLRECDGALGGAAPSTAGGPLPLPMERLLPESAPRPGISGLLFARAESRRRRQKVRHLGVPAHATVEVEDVVPLAHRRRKLRAISLSPEETRALRLRAKAESTTVHGALCAAFSLAAFPELRSFGVDRAAIALGSPVNMRSRLVPPLEDECVLAAALQTTVHEVRRDSDFWALSREIRTEIAAGIERGAPFATVPLASLIARRRLLFSPDRSGIARYAKIAEPAVRKTASVGLTNVGDLTAAFRFRTLEVEWAGFVTSQAFFGFLAATACTANEALRMHLMTTEPMIVPERADAIAQRLSEILAAAAGCGVPALRR